MQDDKLKEMQRMSRIRSIAAYLDSKLILFDDIVQAPPKRKQKIAVKKKPNKVVDYKKVAEAAEKVIDYKKVAKAAQEVQKFRRPPAQYDNKSPYGIASELRK